MPDPQSSAGARPDVPGAPPNPGVESLSEDEWALVVALCAAALGKPRAATAAAHQALQEAQDAAGGGSADPARQLTLATVLAAAWRVCATRLKSTREDTRSPRSRRMTPAGSPPPRSPVAGGSGDLAADVRIAALTLEPMERAGLTLRGRCGLAGGELAEVLGLADEEEVDRLVGRARLTLRASLHGLGRPKLDDDPPECTRALGLIARRRDVGLGRRAEREWLDGHLAGCPRCPGRRLAIGEAALAWRVWTAQETEGETVPTAPIPIVVGRPLVAERAGRPALAPEIRRRAIAAVVGAGLIASGAVVLAPHSTRPPRRPAPPRRAATRIDRHGRPGFTSARVRLPPARPQP